jgi:hypothetical protein
LRFEPAAPGETGLRVIFTLASHST